MYWWHGWKSRECSDGEGDRGEVDACTGSHGDGGDSGEYGEEGGVKISSSGIGKKVGGGRLGLKVPLRGSSLQIGQALQWRRAAMRHAL